MRKVSIILVIIFLVLVLIARQLGFWLVRTDKPEKSDAILLLMGASDDRVPLCVDLYKQGYATQILMVEPYDEKGEPGLKNKGTPFQTSTQKVCDELTEKNIDNRNITILKGAAHNTIDEAKVMATWCQAHPGISKILVVTSPYHTLRAHKIFKRVFEKKKLAVTFLLPFDKYTDYTPAHWYRKRENRKNTFMEVIKLVYYLFWSRWSI